MPRDSPLCRARLTSSTALTRLRPNPDRPTWKVLVRSLGLEDDVRLRHRAPPRRAGRRPAVPARPSRRSGRVVAAGLDRPRAARVERAPGRQGGRDGWAARDRPGARPRRARGSGTERQQRLGVGVGGPVEERVGVGGLDDPPRVHHRDAVGHLADDAEVVRDEQDAHVEVAAQPVEQLEDLRLHGDVEGGRRLVGDEQLGLQRDGHRDQQALPHAAGELVRVGVDPARRRRGCRPARASPPPRLRACLRLAPWCCR